jgi:excisionase family DNA binding protein
MNATITPANAPKLVNVPTAAMTLGISEPFLRTLIRLGKIPCVRMGRRLLVRTRDIDQVIDAGGVAGKAGPQ